MKQPVKDYYNRVIGWIDEKPNGDQIGYDYYHRIVGYYEKRTNLTKDYYRRIVGKSGNMLSSLIFQANAKIEAENERMKGNRK